MRFGYFDDVTREYVITTPRTPYPWINYLGTEEFFGLISHTGGGYTFYQDARMRRLTRYRYNNVPADVGGRCYYLNDNGDVWSPTWAPVQADLDHFEARHGMSYTIITGERRGIRAEILFFVPLGSTAEVHRVRLTNTSDRRRDIDVFSLAEFNLWNAFDDQTNYQRNLSLGEVEVDGSTIYHVTEYRERRNHYALYSVNAPVAGFDTDRDTFLGPYNGFDRPDAVTTGSCRNSIASGWAPIGAHQVPVTLEPGEEKDLIFVLGYVENDPDDKWESPGVVNKRNAHDLLAQFQTTQQVDNALAELRAYWDDLLSVFTVETGDPKVDRMVNIWNPYQCMVTFNMSRSASYFESGIGRGMGFRDSNQDLLGFVHLVPERARERILDIAATQLADGSAYHQYQPLTKRGNDDVGSGFNDDPLWLIEGVARLCARNRRPVRARRRRAVRQRPDEHRPSARAPAPLVPARPGASWTARTPTDRAGRLERLSQPQLLLDHTGRVVPDHRESHRRGGGVGVHRRAVRPCRSRLRRSLRGPRVGRGGGRRPAGGR